MGQRYDPYFDRKSDGVAESENERYSRELKERYKRRNQWDVIEYASKQRENFAVDSMFFMIANSEYCSETLSTLKWEYSVEEFLELASLVDYYNDLRQAAEMDNKNAEDKRAMMSKVSGNM